VRAVAAEGRARQAEAEFKSTGSFFEKHMGFKAITRNPNSALVPRTNSRQKAHLEAFKRQTGKKKNINDLTRPMLLSGISQEDKVVPCLHLLLELGTTCRKGSARALKNSTTTMQWPSLKRVNSATSLPSLRLPALQIYLLICGP